MFNKITCAAVLEHFLQGESKKKTSEDWLKLCVEHFRRVVLSRLVSIDRMQALSVVPAMFPVLCAISRIHATRFVFSFCSRQIHRWF